MGLYESDFGEINVLPRCIWQYGLQNKNFICHNFEIYLP